MKLQPLAGFLALILSVQAWGGDWAMWRGPEQNGMSRETGLPETWDPDSGENVAWKNEKVGGMSSVVVMNGRVYAWTRTGEVAVPQGGGTTLVVGPHTQESLACMDAATGKTLWEYKVNMSQTDVPFHRLGWGNVVADPQTKRVYGYGTQGHLVCLNAESGERIWYHQMLEEYGMISTFGGRTESPTVDEDQLFLTGVAFGWGDNAQGQHRCFAFDKMTGAMRWTAGTGGRPVDAPYGTPIVTVVNGVRMVTFCAGDGGVYGFRARTGEKIFGYKLSKRGTNSTPLIIGDKLIACSSEESEETAQMGRIACLDLSKIEPSSKTIAEAWRIDGIEAGFPSPTTDGKGTVYILDNSAKVHAIDLASGKKKWDAKVGTIGKASLVWADGKLYACDNKNFAIVRPPEEGKKKAKVEKIELGADAQTLGREYLIFGSPAVSDGRIYLQTAAGTWCVGPKEIKKQEVQVSVLAKEEPADKNAAVAVLQVVPCDVVVRAGEKVNFKVRTFDEKGRLIAENVKAEWSIGKVTIPAPPNAPAGTEPTQAGNLKGKVEDGVYTAESGPPQGGAVVANVGGKSGFARVRVMPDLPWKLDFEQAVANKPPLTWVNAGGKFRVVELPDKTKALMKSLDIDLYHAARTFFGDTHRAGYTIEADIMVGSKTAGGQRQMPDAGVIANKYSLVLMGNHQQVIINSWSGALPKEGQEGYALYAAIPYKWEPEKWYHLKLSVAVSGSEAQVRGKVWAKGENEPEKWTLELKDKQANTEGSPGVFGESLVTPVKSEIWYDNIVVSPNK